MSVESPRPRVPWIALTGAVVTMAASAFFAVNLSAQIYMTTVRRNADGFEMFIWTSIATFAVILVGGGMARKSDPIRALHSVSPPATFVFLGGALGSAISVRLFDENPVFVAITMAAAALSGLIWWRKARRIDRLLRHGHHAEGVFEAIGSPGPEDSASFHSLPYTVVHLGPDGREARVTGRRYFASDAIPRKGDLALVWVDRLNPDRHHMVPTPRDLPTAGATVDPSREVSGVLEEVRFAPVRVDAPTVGVRYVVAITAHGGSPTRLSGVKTFPAGKPPSKGERVLVWRDPARPDRHAVRRATSRGYDD